MMANHGPWIALALALSTSASWAQVGARTVTPAEVRALETGKHAATGDQPMKSPMLLEIPLRSSNGLPVPVWLAQVKGAMWISRETNKYVVDRARVAAIAFTHRKPKADSVAIEISASFTSEWFRQDLDVTISLLGLDGKEIARRFWDDETIGNDTALTFGGHSKTLELDAKVPRAEWNRWMAEEGSPLIRILVDVQGEPAED